MHPTIVVPVLVAFGNGTPLACRAALRVWLEKSKPGIVSTKLNERDYVWDLGIGMGGNGIEFWEKSKVLVNVLK